MNTKIVKLIIVVILYFTMTSCGNKGDLYLPEEKQDQQKEQPVTDKKIP